MSLYALDPFVSTNPPGCCGMGDAGPAVEPAVSRWMKAGDCQKFLDAVETYTRLANKANKSAETRERAAQYAAGSQLYYNQCLERKAQAEVQAIIQQQPAVPSTQSVQPAAPGTPPVSGSPRSWITDNKILLIGGGVVLAGVVAYIVLRKR